MDKTRTERGQFIDRPGAAMPSRFESTGGGWFDVSWGWHRQYEQVATDAPLGPASVSKQGMAFTREFENRTAWVNCADGTYSLGG